ncbi:MAG: hypothetical protein QM696_11120 [Steroidobacteraceae bacterium]
MEIVDPTPSRIVSRILASLVGGYGFVGGLSALGIALLMAGGMAYAQAWMLAMLLAFVLFLVLICWAFVAASVARVWMVLAGSGAAMTLAAWLVVHHLRPVA